jgi:peptide deformylase
MQTPDMELLKEDDRLLRRKSKRVDKIDDTIRNIAANMVECMEKNKGIGLAAPQVGILKRIIVVLVNEQPKVMVNPEIISISEKTCVMNEGCLSFPEQFYDIERPEKVTIKYRNLSGHPMTEIHEGLTARCVLHEIDHLEGIVFTERK